MKQSTEPKLNESLAADLEQADEDSIRRILQKVETLGQKIGNKYIEETDLRRRRSNSEGNRFISGFGDPRLVERWRIYRLVEERANAVEKEVADEVRREMEDRRRKRKEEVCPPRSATELLRRVERLKTEIKEELEMNVGVRTVSAPMSKAGIRRMPAPKLKNGPTSRMSATKFKEGPPFKRIEPKNGARANVETDEALKRILSPPKELAIRKKNTVKYNNSSEDFEMLKVSRPSPNVALFVTKERPIRRQPIIHLSGHVLQGVDIAPVAPNPSVSVIIMEESERVALKHDEITVHEKSAPKNHVAQYDSPKNAVITLEKQISDVISSSAITDNIEMLKLKGSVGEKHTESERKAESFENYSDSFEELSNTSGDKDDLEESDSDEEVDEDLNTVCSVGSPITDRLSTIPEDPTKSKSTSESNTIIVDVVAEQLIPSRPITSMPINNDTGLSISTAALSESSLNISIENSAAAENAIGKMDSAKPEPQKENASNEKGTHVENVEVSERLVEVSKKQDVLVNIIELVTDVKVTTVTAETQTTEQSRKERTGPGDNSEPIESESSLSSPRLLTSSQDQEEVSDLSEGQVLFCGKEQLSEGELFAHGESRYSDYFGDLSSDSGDQRRSIDHKGPKRNISLNIGSSSELSDIFSDQGLKPVINREDHESDGELKMPLR